MSLKNTHIFTLEHQINPSTGRPFGSMYTGDFKIRRPTIKDKDDIAVMEAARLARYGSVDTRQLNKDTLNRTYIFTYMSVIGIDVPTWFDPSQLFDDNDEVAIYSVWQEVSRWLDTFRPQASAENSSTGSGQPSVLVPE